LTFNGIDYNTDGYGKVELAGVDNGTYNYNVNVNGYEQASGTATVNDADITETIMLVPTGIKVVHNLELELYPNPASNYINIKNVPGFSYATIYNSSGQAVFNYQNSSVSEEIRINIVQLDNGIYFLKSKIGNQYHLNRFIVNN